MSGDYDDATPWEERDGWRDIRPVPQDDAPNALCQIAYHAEYRNAMDAFRYLVSIKEKSARGVELTEAIVRQNPSHYSVWAYRSECLLASKADLSKELDLMEELIKLHLKSYQVWQHRRTIVLALNDPSRELGFTSRALAEDSKNYHTWAYRQWVLCHFWGIDSTNRTEEAESIWSGEVAFAESMLSQDVRNNSAWNHRFFVVFESGSEKGQRDKVVERELSYVKDKLSIAPNNTSAWNYLRGILHHVNRPLVDQLAFAKPLSAREPPVNLAVEYVADALATSHTKAEREEAAELYSRLADKLDPIRRAFYQMKRREALDGPA